jgi:hypothetical protein
MFLRLLDIFPSYFPFLHLWKILKKYRNHILFSSQAGPVNPTHPPITVYLCPALAHRSATLSLSPPWPHAKRLSPPPQSLVGVLLTSRLSPPAHVHARALLLRSLCHSASGPTPPATTCVLLVASPMRSTSGQTIASRQAHADQGTQPRLANTLT